MPTETTPLIKHLPNVQCALVGCGSNVQPVPSPVKISHVAVWKQPFLGEILESYFTTKQEGEDKMTSVFTSLLFTIAI